MTDIRKSPELDGLDLPKEIDDRAFAFRIFGEAIHEIGLRDFNHELTLDEIAAVRFLAENVISWCEK